MSGFAFTKEEARGYDNAKVCGVGMPPTERDPDSVEQLLQQALTGAFENKEALSNLRHTLLGAWPVDAANKTASLTPDGLVPNLKQALYALLDVQREQREHIATISKGVR